MQTTAAIAGSATSLGNAFVGTATGLASKTVAEGINHLRPDVVASDITHVLSGGAKLASEQATSITSASLDRASVLADGTTHAISEGLSLVKGGETAVKENISHLISGEHVTSPGLLVSDVKAAMTEKATKVAHALDSVNPLHLHQSTESKDAQVCVILSCIPRCHGRFEFLAESNSLENRPKRRIFRKTFRVNMRFHPDTWSLILGKMLFIR